MYDLVVLGGGSGGLSVATMAARFGAKVALIEKNELGGECTHSACVPSKALIEAARLVHAIRTADRFGIRVAAPEVDFPAVMARVRALVAEFAGSGDSLKAQGIDLFRGSPAFEAYDTVLIDGKTRINGQRFVIATGSRAAVPKIPGLAEVGHLDPVSLWNLTALPETLIVIGAEPSGIEFAQAFARLGSKVTVLADTDQILPREDREVSDQVQARLAADGIEFHTGVEVTKAAKNDGRTVCSWRKRVGGATGEVSGSHLLVATGRLANVEGLNLDAVGVHADPEHGIEVDESLLTRSSRIYAIGDVLLKHEFTHAAEREAAVVYQNAVLRLSKKIDYTALPWAVFVDPEVATVGLTEAVALEQHPDARVFHARFDELDRARIDGRTEGFAKVMVTPSGKILGATIVGEQASLILQEFVVAMENGLNLGDLAATTHTYPTYAGMAQTLANQFAATRHEGSLVQSALKWFLGFNKPRSEPENGTGHVVAEAESGTAAAGHSNNHGH
ncbi:Pyruvate/2-oxoglutarate dehydrogenase complex, dihydrolipoamide dehydrogenase (E3) component [Singulisphaera sp. GP187]|uniref:dihydrolipoyl dehydrogenase family protein n=1 Tax=Singulisphaera sp. GP187 TaxID=1882752 RepID=UPI00092B6BAF|nr:FAD-dependent oxidoreductase [Singulisphaera sp. GP187]SIN80256.1 Pyruvate/2-oxoglutarate dehydrogenase complex, dihydrolipoamide dehydrogenase (E3) component [Singulisphaera sp. GP187]